MFGGTKSTNYRKNAHLNVSDGNLSITDENLARTTFVRRARSFKNDVLDKLKAVNNASFRLNRTVSPKPKRARSRIHSETELKYGPEENALFDDVEDILKQLNIALKHFQVAAKTKTEMLPGNGTVILEILTSFKMFLATKIVTDTSPSLISATNFVYKSMADLITICDQVLLESSNGNFILNQDSVLETALQLNNAVEALVKLVNDKLTSPSTNLKSFEAINHNDFRPKSIDVPLSSREKDYFKNNYVNESIFKHFRIQPMSSPMKPYLLFTHDNENELPPPLPPKKRNLTNQFSDIKLLPDQSDGISIRSSSSQNESFLCESVDSMDSILADLEPEYRQFENLNSNETLNDSNSINQRLSNSESGIGSTYSPRDSTSMSSNNKFSMFSLSTSSHQKFEETHFACDTYSSSVLHLRDNNKSTTISKSVSTSTSSSTRTQISFKNCSSLPPSMPSKQSVKERQLSPYDNMFNSFQQKDAFQQSCYHQSSNEDLEKPPLPPKKKHIMVYMEMIGNCSHTSVTNIENQFDKIFVEKSQNFSHCSSNYKNICDNDEMPPALPPKKNKLFSAASIARAVEESKKLSPSLNNNDIKEVNKEQQSNVKFPDLYDLEFLDFDAIFDQYLLKRNKHEDGPDIKGGYLNALVFLAVKNFNNDYAYQNAFLTTYRTFMSPLALIKKLIKHYQSLSCQLDREFRLRDLLSFLSKVLNDLIVTDLDNELLTCLMEFIQLLICNGDLVQAKILRVSLIKKYNRKEMFRVQSNLPPSLTLNTDNYLLLDFKSDHLAEQMTLLDANLFEKIEIPEVLIWAQEQNEERSPNLTKFTEHFNKMSYWVRSRILERGDAKEREKYVSKFIKIMKYLRKINNFNSYLAILSALDSAPVRRLEWQKQITEGLKEYCALIDSSSSFRAYRQALSETQPPCIPYIGLVLQDLTFIHTGNNDFLPNNMINFSKRWQQYNVVENLQKFKKGLYNFKRNQRILTFLNNFDNFMCEEAMWHISESIKPRGSKKSTLIVA